MTRQGQEVLEVFETQMAEDLHHHHVDRHSRERLLEDETQRTGKSGNRIITSIICIMLISEISVINVTSEIMGVKCNNAYNVVIRVLFYNYIRAKETCVIMVL